MSRIKGGAHDGGVSKTAGKETAEILHKLLDRSLEERIRERAYELYVQRGSQYGRADLDWYEAEEELLANR
jgi:hypothetical protein